MRAMVYKFEKGRVVKVGEKKSDELRESKRRDVTINVPAPASAGAKAPRPGGR